MQRNNELSIPDVLRIIRLMKENRLEIKPRQLQGIPNAVALTTAHSSKGLEFDYVFMFNAGKKEWQGGGGNMNRFSLPDTITHNDPVQEEESRRRLWYVAMTRAKKSLRISFSETDVSGRSIEYAPYIDELTEAGLAIANGVVAEEAVIGMALELLQPEATMHLNLPTQEVLNALLKDFSLSASSLEAYLRCQLGFFYQHLLKIPSGDSMAASFGSAMHAAMEQYFLEMQKHAQREFGPKEQLIALFQGEMQRRKPFFDPTHYERYVSDGQFHLDAYYDHFRPTWVTNVRIERGAWKVPVDGVPLNGRLDRIDILEGNQVRVVDYKTGKVREEFVKPNYTYDDSGKGKYWRQLLFYKLLLENSKPALKVNEAVISGLQKDVDGTIPWLVPPISDQDLEDMKLLIKDTWNKIQAHEFTQGCGRADCEWCNLHRDFPETNPFATKKEEDLDDLS
jgi:DNA helicase-2/ATP-dependent DNA helicase PcrA